MARRQRRKDTGNGEEQEAVSGWDDVSGKYGWDSDTGIKRPGMPQRLGRPGVRVEVVLARTKCAPLPKGLCLKHILYYY